MKTDFWNRLWNIFRHGFRAFLLLFGTFFLCQGATILLTWSRWSPIGVVGLSIIMALVMWLICRKLRGWWEFFLFFALFIGGTIYSLETLSPPLRLYKVSYAEYAEVMRKRCIPISLPETAKDITYYDTPSSHGFWFQLSEPEFRAWTESDELPKSWNDEPLNWKRDEFPIYTEERPISEGKWESYSFNNIIRLNAERDSFVWEVIYEPETGTVVYRWCIL
ncbi:MAG: hypothetical protein Q4C70_14285 [Planctomycetia bacterium]|nr:hypothetical protein [Planctomycetia bacterium]